MPRPSPSRFHRPARATRSRTKRTTAVAAVEETFMEKEARYYAEAKVHDRLSQRPTAENTIYLRNGKRAYDDHYDMAQPERRAIGVKHPKIAAAKKDGTLTDKLQSYFEHMDPRFNIPLAGLPAESPFGRAHNGKAGIQRLMAHVASSASISENEYTSPEPEKVAALQNLVVPAEHSAISSGPEEVAAPQNSVVDSQHSALSSSPLSSPPTTTDELPSSDNESSPSSNTRSAANSSSDGSPSSGNRHGLLPALSIDTPARFYDPYRTSRNPNYIVCF
ncbi:hypothetical protein QBC35DRAFT_116247 [Podospora australis]|uniref:Uncharacterized protein n=1 Tax=Podospora australis TaxID=1536484 RepID=A0AAN7AJX2_9PEZI|nr:hypothetical protein QBC35DRAFT_116247 [Podospora australis]